MRPIVLVKQFHKLSRTVEFDLFGFLNLEILNFKVGSSTDYSEKFEIRKFPPLDNVQNSDWWGLHGSGTARAGKRFKT
jgi:hypothetical protein